MPGTLVQRVLINSPDKKEKKKNRKKSQIILEIVLPRVLILTELTALRINNVCAVRFVYFQSIAFGFNPERLINGL